MQGILHPKKNMRHYFISLHCLQKESMIHHAAFEVVPLLHDDDDDEGS